MADKRIKGITIEIGSDTVGLEKALSDVNKQSMTLQNELKSVEKLLKFNPGNVEALVQKQQLLTQQVQATTDKLNQLKAAEQQVQQQFQQGSISEEQYRAFRREIEYTQGSLGKLKNELASMEKEQVNAANATKQLNTLFEATGTSVDNFASALGGRLTNAIKSGTASSKQLDDAINKIGTEALGTRVDLEKMKQALASIDDGKSISNVKKDLNNLSKEADGTKKSIKELDIDLENMLGAAVAGGGISGAVQKSLDTSTLKTKIDVTFEVPEASKKSVELAVRGVTAYGVDAEAALEGVRRQWALNKTASDESNATVAKGAAVIASSYSGIDFNELIQETNEIAKALGISNEQALALTNSLLKAGFPPDQLDIISEYGTQLQRAGYSAKEVQALFAAGVDTKTWNIDNLLDGLKEGRIRVAEFGQSVPQALSDLLAKTDISTKQIQTWGQAVAAGGEGGSKAMNEIAKALNGVQDQTLKNALGVQIFGTQYEDQGQNIISTLLNAKNATVDLKTNQDQLNTSVSQMNASPAVQLQQAIQNMLVALEPTLIIIANIITALAQWASDNPTLVATIVAIVTVIGILIGICFALAPVFITLTSLAGALGISVGAVTWPVLLVVGAIAALIAIGVALWQNWDTVKSKAVELWNQLGPFQDVFLALTGPIGSVIGMGIKLWQNWDTIKEKAAALRNTVMNIFSGVSLSLPDIKLPHFSLRNWSINPLDWASAMPSIDVAWYKNGGLFPANSPRMIGIGDASVPEAALPLSDSVLGTIASMISKHMDTGNVNFADMFRGSTFVVREEADIQKLARELGDYIKGSGRRV